MNILNTTTHALIRIKIELTRKNNKGFYVNIKKILFNFTKASNFQQR
jgi:hypothetical protein